MKIKITTTMRGDPDEGRATITVTADGKKIASGHVGGEPEDNCIYRDYAWISGALASVAKACGVSVEEVEETASPDDD